MKFFKSILSNIIHYLQFITLGFLKFLSKLQSKVNNLDKEHYSNLKSSLEKELSEDEAVKAMASLAKEYEELEKKPNTYIGDNSKFDLEDFLNVISRGDLDDAINKEEQNKKDQDRINYSKLRLELENEFNLGSKYSEFMNQIRYVENKYLNKAKMLLNDKLREIYSHQGSKSKFVFDKEKREAYELYNIQFTEISEAAKKCKMIFVNNFNEELERIESPINDIDCKTYSRSDTSEPAVTEGTLYNKS